MIKKVIKKLAKSKNIPTFAVSNTYKSGENYRPSYREAFFYALSVRNNIGSVPPCNFRNGIATALVVCWTTAKAEPLFCFSPYHSERNNKQNFFKMSNKKNLCLYGTAYPTNTHGKGEILHSFTKATAFIFLFILLFMLHTCTTGRVALSHFQNSSL